MAAYLYAKRTVQQLAAWTSCALAPWVKRSEAPRVCILVYHRVAPVPLVDPDHDDWNVPPSIFADHMACLAEHSHLVRLSEVSRYLQGESQFTKPVVAVTFDDGFANLIHYALPWLVRYQVPATWFVVTAEIGSPQPMAFDRWSRHNAPHAHPALWRAATWSELDLAADTGLISLGGHSHTHPAPRPGFVPPYIEEVNACRNELVSRYGNRVTSYAYPYGSTRLGFVPPEHVAAVQQAGFSLAVTTDLGLAAPEDNCYRLPRIEALACDTPTSLRAKIKGALAPYQVTALLRRAQRTH
jgi:peptidoglycan/xylan/chitin deacetylase (PgdA/CDA1 family)